jgi:hypothetical protein
MALYGVDIWAFQCLRKTNRTQSVYAVGTLGLKATCAETEMKIRTNYGP